MSNSARAIVSILLCGTALRVSAEEPISAVWDVPDAESLKELRADWLRDEALSVLARQHVLNFSHAELLSRWESAEKAWEQRRQQAAIATQAALSSAMDEGLPVSAMVPANALVRRLISTAHFPVQTEQVDPFEKFQRIWWEFSQALPGHPQLRSTKEAGVEAQFASNAYVGLGVAASIDQEQRVLVFAHIIPGGSAERAGLKNGVKVWTINGWNTRDQPMSEMINRLRGPRGTSVTLRIEQDNATRDIEIRRDLVRFASFTDSESRQSPQARWAHPKDGRVAYLNFQQLLSSTVHELREAEDALRRSQCRSLIFDFRQLHRTGDWRHVQLLADALIAGGVLWDEIDREGQVMSVPADADCLFRDLPLIVVISPGRADQARTLAVALQQSGRAILIEEDSMSRPVDSDSDPMQEEPVNSAQTDPILGFPTEVESLAGGAWMLSVPTRQWRVPADSPATPGMHYTFQIRLRPSRDETVLVLGKRMKRPAVSGTYDSVAVIKPPLPNSERPEPKDAIELALELARDRLAKGATR